MALELEIHDGGDSSRHPTSPGQEIRAGRVQDMDLVLTSPGVSRHHATFHVSEGGVRVENHSTTKAGTRVNGERIEDVTLLIAGDRVALGQCEIRLCDGAAPAAESVPAAKPARAKAAPKKPRKTSGENKLGAATEGGPEASGEGAGKPSKAAAARAAMAERAAKRQPSEPIADPGPEDDEASDDAPRSAAREATEAFVARKEKERLVKRVVVALGVLVALGFGAHFASQALDARVAQQPGASPQAGTPGAQPATGSGGGVDAPPPIADADGPEEAWAGVRESAPGKLAEALETFAAAYPNDRRAEDARFFAKQMAQQGGGDQPRALQAAATAMLEEAKRLIEAKEPSRAHAVYGLVEALVPGSPQARQAEVAKGRLAEVASEAFAELEARAGEISARLSPVQAIVAVLEASPRLRGLGVDARLDDLVAKLEQEAARHVAQRAPAAFQRSGEAFTVEQDMVNAALRFDFARAKAEGAKLLLLGLDEEERLRAHWLRVQVHALRELYDQLLVAAKGPLDKRPTCTLRGALRVRLASSAKGKATLNTIAAPGEKPGELTWPWSRFGPTQIQELLESVGGGDLRYVIAKAFHAFRTGLDERGVELLIPYASRKSVRGEVFSFYSLVTGVPLPEGGFVVYEGRLVSPAEKAKIIADREEARATAKALAQDAREERSRQKLLILLRRVLAIMDQGHYQAGRAALARLAKQHADVEGVGDVARARLESPLLRRRDLRASRNLGRNGPPKNRLDVYFLGDGYAFDDRKQLQFDRHADSAAKSCQLQDFFKEYDQYFNYWGVNLESKEEGLSKDGTGKDTALGTEINGGVHTVADRGRVFALLEKYFPGEHDRLAVVIGNDYATVATGGGGTVAVCKTMLEATPHEIGHALGNLGDEYDQEPRPNAPPPPPPPAGAARAVRINVVQGPTRQAALDAAPWKAWHDPTGENNWTGKPIGVFEGANRRPRGFWRPQNACVMRDIGSPFCAVCMETMVRALYRYVKPIDQVWPAESELTAGREPITFRVLVLKPQNHPVFVHWRRKVILKTPERPETGEEGANTRERGRQLGKDEKEVTDISGKLQVIEGRYVHYIKITPRKLKPGRYEISAEAYDPTPWVRKEHRAELTQTQRWTLVVP